MIEPGAWLGVVGGGQLGRMFTLRARAMGYHVVVLEPDPRSPAGAAADRHLVAPYDDPAALSELAESCAAITIEFENVPADVLTTLARTRPVRPSARAVAIVQDRISEKRHVTDSGFRTAPFRPVRSALELSRAVAVIGTPALLKTARFGYDGKGQVPVTSPSDAAAAWRAVGEVPSVLERRLALELELSVVLARGTDGRIAAFPPGENRHRNGILETTVVPARIPPALALRAQEMAAATAESLEYVGVMGVELFLADGGQLYVNEIAPRPHNSGHYTIDGCDVDQFEQQVRALCEAPLGSPRLLSPVAMVNLLGDLWAGGTPNWERALAFPGVRLHLYGKAQARPGRKMGHINCLAATPEQALETALAARDALGAGK
jgi:5-(carboxyamino)imidazole ribonucleotide synthase